MYTDLFTNDRLFAIPPTRPMTPHRRL